MSSSLASRAGLLTGIVASIAVVIAGVVSLQLVRDAAENQVQANLHSQAELVMHVAENPNDFDMDHDHIGKGGDNNQQLQRALVGVVQYLGAQGIQVTAVIPGQSEPSHLTSNEIQAVANGQSVSTRSCSEGDCVFIEARPVGSGTGIALIQPMSVASAVTANALGRIITALLAGLVVAILIGLWAARRLTRPLQNAAQAAHQLAEGQRDIRLQPEGPTEIAEIAIALNTLSEQLVISEDRQREFLLSVSHELRTPLTAIRGYAEAMRDGVVESGDMEHVGSVVSSESVRLDRLVADLLDLARTGAVDFPLLLQDTDLVDVVSDACDVWQARCDREGVQFVSELPAGSILVHSDPIRIRQIIDNLAENALRVTPSGQPIVIALTDAAVIEVRDGGPGLTEADQKVAFQPGELYEKYKGVRRVGTGFGLALVGRLAERLGAEANVDNAPEGGARFRIDFAASTIA